MKKLLLATSALVVSAGVASAQGVELSGKAYGGILDSGTGDFRPYNGAEVTATLSGVSDNGLEFGSSVTMRAKDGARDGFGFDPFGESTSTNNSGGTFWIGAGGFKLTIDNDGVDDLYDSDNAEGDIQISYAANGISFDLTHDLFDDTPHGSSYKVAYNGGGFSASFAGNDMDQSVIALGYGTDMFELGLELDDDATFQTTTLSGSYNFGGGSVGVAFKDRDDGAQQTKLEGSFSTGGIDISASYIDDPDGIESYDTRMTIEASMDAGGGLTIGGGYRTTDTGGSSVDAMYLEASAKF